MNRQRLPATRHWMLPPAPPEPRRWTRPAARTVRALAMPPSRVPPSRGYSYDEARAWRVRIALSYGMF